MTRFHLAALACAILAASASAAMVGGATPVDVEEPDVVHAAGVVLSSANANECHGLCAGIKGQTEGDLKLVKVVSATRQVVAGMTYALELLMEDSTGKQVVVNSSVWVRPWLEGKNDAKEKPYTITKSSFRVLDA